jgi:glycosyltransferase involved in cell wall biosynthesis
VLIPVDGQRTSKRPSLAIISTYGDLCGIASYTYFLAKQLSPFFDVEVLKIDSFLTRETRLSSEGDRHIKELSRKAASFDCVSIQFEHGTLGISAAAITRRFHWLLETPSAVSVTMHSFIRTEPMEFRELFKNIRRRQFWDAALKIKGYYRTRRLDEGIMGSIKKEIDKQSHSVSIIVHTKRERRLVQAIYKISSVLDHPLSFLRPEDVSSARSRAQSHDKIGGLKLPDDTVFVGIFGFIARYKGTRTAVQAMQLLPNNYHLLVFGGVHPQAIIKNQVVDPYLDEVLRDIRPGARAVDHQSTSLHLATPASLFEKDPRDISSRVHFMGALDDLEFLAGMSACSTVIIPYLEVGQTSSGPIAQALELGCRVLVARNKAFLEYERYHPGRLEFFDIGNFVELAQKLQAPNPVSGLPSQLDFDADTNAKTYLAAFGLDAPAPEVRIAAE